MRRTILRISAVLLAAILLFGQATPIWAVEAQAEELTGIESFTIFDSEISSLEMQGGYLYKTTTAAGIDESYRATLGPNEEGFSLVATPAETEYPPTLELFLDGSDTTFDTLTPGEPSRYINVDVGDTRKVLLRSTAQKSLINGTTKVTKYELEVHRTNIQFQWTLGETFTAADGGTVLPVTLNAPAGLEMKELQMALGFDRSKLQLCDKAGAISTEFYDVLEAIPDFYYSGSSRTGYFEDVVKLTDNNTGRFMVQFGKNRAASQTCYQVSGERTGVVTLYFKVIDPAFTPDTLYILQDENVSPSAGISVTERSSRVSQCPDMIEIVGLPEPIITHTVRLPARSYGGGTLTVQPDQELFTDGESLTLTAVSASGYSFVGWDAGTTGLTGSTAVLTLTVNRDMDLTTLKPLFEKKIALPAGEGVDTTAPYMGDVLLTVGGSAAAVRSASSDSQPYSEMDVDKNGLTVLDFHDDSEGTEVAANASTLSAQAAYQVGDTATFKTRDTTVTKNTLERPAWPEKKFTLTAAGASVNVWVEVGGKMQLTEAQAMELAQSFDASLTWLKSNCGSIYDRNANEKTDVLLYDIYDLYSETNGTSGGYVAGLTSYAELYGSQGSRGTVGNNADVVHLDTWPAMGFDLNRPDLSTVVSTFAHEAQHLVSFSTNAAWKKTQKNAVIAAANPPDWLNEGLSMAAEHALFGVRSSRIHTFNTSVLIQKGYSLTNWGGKLEDYALSYLFMEYLMTQAEAAGQADFLRNMYTDYTSGAEGKVMELVGNLPQFAGMSFRDVVTAFYAALYLQQDSGVYGYCGNDAFRTVRPRLTTAMAQPLPTTAGVYTKLQGSYTPSEEDGNTYLGLTTPEVTLTATADRGGTVSRRPSKASYSKGEYVVVQALPDEGYLFTGWTGDVPVGQMQDSVITLRLDSAKSVHASFAVDSASQEPTPEPIQPGAILGGDPTVGDDNKTATSTDAEGNRAILKASDVTKLTEGKEIVLTAIPAEQKQFLYWRVDVTVTGSETFSVEGDSAKLTANPLSTTVRTGISYTAVFGKKLPDTGPKLGVLEPAGMEGRQLVSTDPESEKSSFGFREGVYNYSLYLLAEEQQAQLTVVSDLAVTGVTVTGADNAEITLKYSKQGAVRTWTEQESTPLTLTLDAGKSSGAATITITDASEAERSYTVNLIRVSANPAVTIAEELGKVVAKVDNAQLRALSISLKVPKGAFAVGDEVKSLLGELPPGLEYAHATASAIDGDADHWLLNIAVDTGTSGAAYTQPFTIELFHGTLGEVSIYDEDGDNVISDARFGGLYHTTRKAGQVMLSGTVTGYDALALPRIAFEDESGGLITGQITVTGGAAYGLQTFEFTAPLESGKTYTMTVNKARHTGWTITDVVLRVDTQLKTPLTLYAGDLDGDNRVTVFDADMLSLGFGKTDFDLDGDGVTTVFDQDILMGKDNYGGTGKKLEWSAATKGSETR